MSTFNNLTTIELAKVSKEIQNTGKSLKQELKDYVENEMMKQST